MYIRGKIKNKIGARFIIINFIRLLLVIAFIGAIYSNRRLVMIISIAGLVFTFLPVIFDKLFGIKMPAESDVIIFLFIYGALFLGEVRGLYAGFWWWDILLNLISAFALGFVGLTIMYSLHKDKKLNTNPLFVAFFAFLFTIGIGAIWEVFEFTLDNMFGFSLQKSSTDTMKDVIVNIIGALIVSLAGYYYIRRGKMIFISKVVSNFVDKNLGIFKGEERHGEDVLGLVRKGEGSKLEFKSSLRKNLHTQELDKRIEHAVLKTMVAYLNSEGGTLLVGVSDKGDVLGLEHDEFADHDKLNLYFTNLIKQQIGPEYLPFIKYDIVNAGDKHVLKIECSSSNKHVFLKSDKEEEFYIRNGASSAKLSGSALIDYVKNKFGGV